MKKFLLFAFLAAGALSACAPPPVHLQPLPKVTAYMEAPAAPVSEDLSFNLLLKRMQADRDELNNNVTARPGFQVPPNSTVVISVPAEEQATQLRRRQINELNQFDRKIRDAKLEQLAPERTASDMAFQTDGYFNKAEQQIEKSLLEKGFIVLDRAKFEAKLRDRRAKKVDDVYSSARAAAVKDLEERREQDRITQQEYLDSLKEIEDKYTLLEENDSRKAGEKELVDISELIRAAQDESGVSADYLLQVNNFDVKPITDRTVHLSQLEEVRELTKEHQGLFKAMDKANAMSIKRPGYFAYMNAKLIEVKTGSIVWVGEHRVESNSIEDISVDFMIKKFVDNTDDIERTVSQHNKKIKDALENAKYQGRMAKLPGLDRNTQQIYLNRYNTAVNEIEDFNRRSRPELPGWHFDYAVNSPQIFPEFPSQHELTVLEQTVSNLRQRGKDYEQEYNRYLRLKNQMENHQGELIKIVARELLSTIPSGY